MTLPTATLTAPRSVVLPVVLLGVLLGLVLVAGPAHAHTDLLGSSPAAGEEVSADTEELMLSFADEVVPGTAAVSVVGPGGRQATQGTPTVDGALVRVGVRLAATGEHVVSYRVVAADGHVVTGDLRFAVTSSGGSVPTVVPAVPRTDPDPAGPGPLPWLAGTGALLALLAGLHTARRRRSGQWSAGTPRTPESVSSASRAAAASSS